MTPSKDLTFDGRQMAALYRLGKLVRASLDLDATLAAIAAQCSMQCRRSGIARGRSSSRLDARPAASACA